MMLVYFVIMRKWGETETHNYPISIKSDLADAYIEGMIHSNYRAGKYEPAIFETLIDSKEPVKSISLETARRYAIMKYPEKFNSEGKLNDD